MYTCTDQNWREKRVGVMNDWYRLIFEDMKASLLPIMGKIIKAKKEYTLRQEALSRN